MAPTFPPEIWHKIIVLLSSSPSSPSSSATPTNPLHALSLTSRPLLALVRSHIFHTITLDISTPVSMVKTLSRLQAVDYHPKSISGPAPTMTQTVHFHKPVWGCSNPLEFVKSLQIIDSRNEEVDYEGPPHDMYQASHLSTNNQLNSFAFLEHEKRYNMPPDAYADLKRRVTYQIITSLTPLLVRLPALHTLVISLSTQRISFDSFDSSFKDWIHGRLVYGKLKRVEMRGLDDIPLQISAALLGAEEVSLAQCSFAALDAYNTSSCNPAPKDALDLSICRSFAASKSHRRLSKLTYESPHSSVPAVGGTGLAAHWEFLGMGRQFASPIHELKMSITSYTDVQLTSTARLLAMLQSPSSWPSTTTSAHAPLQPSPLRSFNLSLTPMQLSHVSFQPPPNPDLPSSRVVFYPAGSRMMKGHGADGAMLCWMNSGGRASGRGSGNNDGGWDEQGTLGGFGVLDWRDVVLGVKQSASPPPFINARSRNTSRSSSKRRSEIAGSDGKSSAYTHLSYDEDDGYGELDEDVTWFQRLMHSTGFLPSSRLPTFSSSSLSDSLLFPKTHLRSLSLHASFWLNATSTHANGELGFIISYLHSYLHTEKAEHLEELEIRVKVGTGDCIANVGVWLGTGGSQSSRVGWYRDNKHDLEDGGSQILQYEGWGALGRVLSSSSSSQHSAYTQPAPAASTQTSSSLSITSSKPQPRAFTRLSSVSIVLESRLG
ncbi:hypothetical protein CVT24_009525, partial [Panaeolus cyanescens]